MLRSVPSVRHAPRRGRVTALAGTLAGVVALGAIWPGSPSPPVPPKQVPVVVASLGPSILDPRPALSPAARAAWPAEPLAAFRPAIATFAAAAPPTVAQPAAEAAVSRVAISVPLPVPRPTDLREPASVPLAARSRRLRQAAAPVVQEDNRSFFEKLFAPAPAPAPKLAYAALDTGSLPAAPALRLSPTPAIGAGTAIYDISARVVTLPNGERLEAHSGLGDKLDDPRQVHLRMRGPTPPGTYELTERETLFHGVRALRLTPVGGAGAVFGRAGLLAHTFMLGPKGDSNGCVSFRDYDRFLQAYLRGEIRRLVVVTGRAWDAPAGLRFGAPMPAADPARG